MLMRQTSVMIFLVSSNMSKLIIGCGKDWGQFPDCDGVDIVNFGQKFVFDLEVIPWPIIDKTYNEIIAFNVLEHIHQDRVIAVMNECNRVLVDYGLLHIEVPPANSIDEAFSDPTHYSYWTAKTFSKYFCGKSPRNADYGIVKWATDKIDLSDPGVLMITLKK